MRRYRPTNKKRRAPVKQSLWIRQAEKMAREGKSFPQIKLAFPQLKSRSLTCLKKLLGLPVVPGYEESTTAKVNLMRLMLRCGYSRGKIAKIYGIRLSTVYSYLASRP